MSMTNLLLNRVVNLNEPGMSRCIFRLNKFVNNVESSMLLFFYQSERLIKKIKINRQCILQLSLDPLHCLETVVIVGRLNYAIFYKIKNNTSIH